jgi:membrane protein
MDLFADPTTITSHLDSVAGLMPGGAIEIIRDQITRVASQGRATLGLTFLAGLAASLWSANAGMKSLFDAFNLVYNEPEKRSIIWLNIISLIFTVLTILFALVAMGAMVVVPIVLNFIGLGGMTEMVIKIARWPALLIVITFALAFLYRYGPSREKPQWRWITWGGAVAAVSWLVISKFQFHSICSVTFATVSANSRRRAPHHPVVAIIQREFALRRASPPGPNTMIS